MLRCAITIALCCAIVGPVAAQSPSESSGELPIDPIPVTQVSTGGGEGSESQAQASKSSGEEMSKPDSISSVSADQSTTSPQSGSTAQGQGDAAIRSGDDGAGAGEPRERVSTQAGGGAGEANGPESIQMKPGVNQVIQVSTGHLNRFITPFENPAIETSDLDSDQTRINGHVVLISVKEQGPATLFIRPKGKQQPALSLTLVAQPIPPRQVKLKLGDEHMQGGSRVSREQAREWEKSQPYENTLRGLFIKLAKGRIQSGYNVRDPKPTDPRVACTGGPNIELDIAARQVIEGARIRVIVARVGNPTDQAIELREPGCYRKGVLAVATWPLPRIKSGEAVELFMATRIDRETGQPARERPSVLGDEQEERQ